MAKLMTTKLTWLVLIGLCTQALAVDVVTRRSDGTAFRGKITQATRESITLTRSGGQKEVFSVDDLKSVSFDGEPRQIAQARTNERSGAIDAAIATLTEVRRSGAASGKAVRAEVEFLLARMKTRQALVDAEKVEDALAATDAFRRANSNNFRYLEATLLQASLLSLKKDTDKARTLLQEVQTSTVKGFQLQAGVDMGRLMLNSGDPALARAAFDDVISKATDASAMAVRFDARIGRALCRLAAKDFDGAVTELDAVIKDAPAAETALLADAWNRKGDCFRLQNQHKAAVMAYLHVDLLYPGESSHHAEALHYLSSLWSQIGYDDRGSEAAATLTERYPQSPWARK